MFFPCCRRDPVPSVSLEMYEQTMAGVRETEDINTHHLLQQHLYKGRKQVSIFIHITIHYINNRNRLKGDHILFKHAVSMIQVIVLGFTYFAHFKLNIMCKTGIPFKTKTDDNALETKMNSYAMWRLSLIYSTATDTVGVISTSTRTKMRCRRSSRGP